MATGPPLEQSPKAQGGAPAGASLRWGLASGTFLPISHPSPAAPIMTRQRMEPGPAAKSSLAEIRAWGAHSSLPTPPSLGPDPLSWNRSPGGSLEPPPKGREEQ